MKMNDSKRLETESDAMTTGLQPKRQEANFKRLWNRIEPPKKVQPHPRLWQIAAMVSVIAVGLVAWQPTSDSPSKLFHTLSDSSPPASSPRLRVVFADELPQARFQVLLQAAGAQIIGGPSERGVFTLQVNDPAMAFQLLRNQPQVRFAEMAAY